MPGRQGPPMPTERGIDVINTLHKFADLRDLFPIADVIDQAVRQNA